MKNSDQKLSMHDRVQAVLQGKQPDRLPFIDRMEIWYQSKCSSGSLPAKYQEMSLNDIHQSVQFQEISRMSGIGYVAYESRFYQRRTMFAPPSCRQMVSQRLFLQVFDSRGNPSFPCGSVLLEPVRRNIQRHPDHTASRLLIPYR